MVDSIGIALALAVVVVVGKLAALVTEVFPEVTTVVSTFGGFVGNTMLDSLSSFVVVSAGFAVVSAVDVVGKLVVVVITLGLEVTTVVSGIVVVAGTDVMILRVSLVDAVLGSIVSTFGGFVVNTV